jgi:hypothetical protein
MSNLFDGGVVVEYLEGALIFRDIPNGVDKLKILFTAGNPNGSLSAPIGALASGPAGLWINTNGATAWSPAGVSAGAVVQIGSEGGAVITSNSLLLQIAGSVPIAAGALNAVGRTLRCRIGMHCSAKGGIAVPGVVILFGGLVLPFPSNATILGKSYVMDLLLRTTVPGATGSMSITAATTDMPFAGSELSGGVIPAIGPIDFTVAQSLQIGIVWDANNGGLDAVTLDAMVVELG